MQILNALKDWFGLNTANDSARAIADIGKAHADAADDTDDFVDPFDPFPAPVKVEIRDIFNLHTIHPRDVRRVVEEYLREAHAAQFPVVRIIHGKGVGVQREVVRSVLAHTPFVVDWTDAPPEAGGWGATIARLKFTEATAAEKP
ncbi:MAG: Smr/MutS family protein [Pyrinomonadaceae bacterium]